MQVRGSREPIDEHAEFTGGRAGSRPEPLVEAPAEVLQQVGVQIVAVAINQCREPLRSPRFIP